MRPDHYRFAAGILQLVRPELSAASSQCVSECTRASFKLISSQLFYNDWGSDSSDLLPHIAHKYTYELTVFQAV